MSRWSEFWYRVDLMLSRIYFVFNKPQSLYEAIKMVVARGQLHGATIHELTLPELRAHLSKLQGCLPGLRIIMDDMQKRERFFSGLKNGADPNNVEITYAGIYAGIKLTEDLIAERERQAQTDAPHLAQR